MSPPLTHTHGPAHAPTTDPRHAVRVRAHLAQWRAVPELRHVADMLEDGVGAEFLPTGAAHFKTPPKPYVLDDADRVRLFIDKGVRVGAWELLSEPPLGQPYSHGFVIPKKNGDLRVISDLTPVNALTGAAHGLLPLPTFSLPALGKVAAALSRDDHASVGDIVDAFYIAGLCHTIKPWFVVLFTMRKPNGTILQLWIRYLALAMGWSASPAILELIFGPVVTFLNRLCPGVTVTRYVDDFLASGSAGALRAARPRIIAALEALGLQLSPKANFGIQGPSFVYLGLGVNTRDGVLWVPQKKLAAFHRVLKGILGRARAGRVPARLLASVAGQGQSLAPALPAVRHYLQSVYALLRVPTGCRFTGDVMASLWKRELFIPRAVQRDLRSLMSVQDFHTRRLLWPSPCADIWTDASTTGWGGVLRLRHSPLSLPVYGFWEAAQRTEPIHILELRAVFMVLRKLVPELLAWTAREHLPRSGPLHTLELHVDNTVAVHTLRRYASAVPHMHAILRQNIATWDSGVARIRYVHTSINPADKYSRLQRREVADDYSLTCFALARLERLYGPFSIELFCGGPANRLLTGAYCAAPGFVPAGAGSCVGDAWSLHWGALSVPYPRLYGNPPFSELHKLPAKVEEYLAGPPSPTLGPPQQPPRLLFHEEKNPHAFSGAAPALVLILPQWNTPAIASLRATALEEVHLGRIGFRAPGGGATLEAPPWATLALRWRRDP